MIETIYLRIHSHPREATYLSGQLSVDGKGDISAEKRYERISSKKGLPALLRYIFSPKVKTYNSYDLETFNHSSIGPEMDLFE